MRILTFRHQTHIIELRTIVACYNFILNECLFFLFISFHVQELSDGHHYSR
jgi:hypothetical protein